MRRGIIINKNPTRCRKRQWTGFFVQGQRMKKSGRRPVFLIQNGRGRFMVMDIEDYEREKTEKKLLTLFGRGYRNRDSVADS